MLSVGCSKSELEVGCCVSVVLGVCVLGVGCSRSVELEVGCCVGSQWCCVSGVSVEGVRLVVLRESSPRLHLTPGSYCRVIVAAWW